MDVPILLEVFIQDYVCSILVSYHIISAFQPLNSWNLLKICWEWGDLGSQWTTGTYVRIGEASCAGVTDHWFTTSVRARAFGEWWLDLWARCGISFESILTTNLGMLGGSFRIYKIWKIQWKAPAPWDFRGHWMSRWKHEWWIALLKVIASH